MRALDVAQHEAAHVVVGVALGLQLAEACVLPPSAPLAGHAIFYRQRGDRLALATMYAAGIAHEVATGGDPCRARLDRRRCRELVSSAMEIETCVRLARALLETRSVALARVTRALAERDLCAADVDAIARGARR